MSKECPECHGEGRYFTEWSDAAESSLVLKAMVRYYPDPPDGTVEIECQVCLGTGSLREYLRERGREE